jgi:hypothetical protein
MTHFVKSAEDYENTEPRARRFNLLFRIRETSCSNVGTDAV